MKTDPPTEQRAPESVLQTNIANVFIRHGLMTTRFNSGAARDGSNYIPFYRVLGIATRGKARKIESGLSDLTIGKYGFLIYVEVKRPGESLRPSQRIYKAICEAFHMPYEVARSVEEAEAIVAKYSPIWERLSSPLPN